MRHALFVYGTLQLPEKLRALLGRVPRHELATLQGYRSGLVARADFPGIVPQQGNLVQGQILFSLAHQELECLDLYEGELYQRVRISAETSQGLQSAWVYVIVPWARDRVTQQEWSIARYRANKKPRLTYRN